MTAYPEDLFAHLRAAPRACPEQKGCKGTGYVTDASGHKVGCVCRVRTLIRRQCRVLGIPSELVTFSSSFSLEEAETALRRKYVFPTDERRAKVEQRINQYADALPQFVRGADEVRSLVLTGTDSRLLDAVTAYYTVRYLTLDMRENSWIALYNWGDICAYTSSYKREDELTGLLDDVRNAQLMVISDVTPTVAVNGQMRQRLEWLLKERNRTNRPTVITSSYNDVPSLLANESWSEFTRACLRLHLDTTTPAVDGAEESDFVLEGTEDILATLDERVEWLVPDLIPMNSVTLITAPAGQGKSLVGLELSLAASGNLPKFLNQFTFPNPIPSLYVDEDSNNREVFAERLHSFGFSASFQNFYRRILKNFKLDEIGQVQNLLASCTNYGIKLLILGSLNPMHSKNEQCNDDMRAVMNNLRLFTTNGITVVVLHHEGKGFQEGGNLRQHRSRGATAIIDAVDMSYSIGPDSEVEGAKILRPAKERHRTNLYEIRFRPEKNEDGVLYLNGKVRRKGEASDYNKRVDDEEMDRRILEFLASQQDEVATARIKEAVTGKMERIVESLNSLIARGMISMRESGNRKFWRIVPA